MSNFLGSDSLEWGKERKLNDSEPPCLGFQIPDCDGEHAALNLLTLRRLLSERLWLQLILRRLTVVDCVCRLWRG